MNFARLRQIIELRKASKAPPLIPPRVRCKAAEATENHRSSREIIDVHLKLRKFYDPHSEADSIVCIMSESEDAQHGPWRASTASEIVAKGQSMDFPFLFAMEFQLERCRYIRLDICDFLESKNRTMSLGYTAFSISELVVSGNGTISRSVINDENGVTIASALIYCTLRPKPHSVLVQFSAKNPGKKQHLSSAAPMLFYFEIHLDSNPIPSSTESDDGGLIYRSEPAKCTNSRVLWRAFSLQSEQIATRALHVLLLSRDSKSAKNLLGHTQVEYAVLRRGPSEENIYQFIYSSSKGLPKSCGEFQLLRIAEVALPSFLEFITSGTVLNMAVAVDFSQPSTQVKEQDIRQFKDDVTLTIRALGEPLKEFNISNSFAAFGLGGKVPPHFRESQEFCLNLDTNPYCKGLSGVQRAFEAAFANVQPLNIAHLSHVIYYVAKLAQNSLNKQQAMGIATPTSIMSASGQPGTTYPSYYVLIIMTRGIFDDLRETVQAIIFASRAPLSVIFVGVGADNQSSAGGIYLSESASSATSNMQELERLATAGTKLNFHGRRPERDCIQYVNIGRCRAEENNPIELRTLIAEKALQNISWQMTSWLTKNAFKPDSKIVVEPTFEPPDDTTVDGGQGRAGLCESERSPGRCLSVRPIARNPIVPRKRSGINIAIPPPEQWSKMDGLLFDASSNSRPASFEMESFRTASQGSLSTLVGRSSDTKSFAIGAAHSSRQEKHTRDSSLTSCYFGSNSLSNDGVTQEIVSRRGKQHFIASGIAGTRSLSLREGSPSRERRSISLSAHEQKK